MNDIYSKLNALFSSPVQEDLRVPLVDLIRLVEPRLTPVWHPLGFIHAKVAEGPAGDTFRLHVWSSEHTHPHEQREKIHDHLFNIRSRVVVGSVTNIRYNFVPNSNGSYRVVKVDYQPEQSSLKETALFGELVPADRQLYDAPTEYTVSRYELHETILADSKAAITIVHTTDPVPYEPCIIFRRESATPPPRTPIPCDKSLWRTILGEMLPTFGTS